MSDKRHKVLIVDDDRLNIDILVDTLSSDYDTYVAKNGHQALLRVDANPPDIILLDIMMPDLDGYEVCRRLKSNHKTKDIPVIFISAMSEVDNEFRGLELGATDYLIKPVNPKIVKVRVRNHLTLRDAMLELERLNQLALDANPNTGLPGNNTITRIVSDAIFADSHACVVYADLDHFKEFNDKYGFARGDDVIRFTAQLLKEVPREFGCRDPFVGHIGGDDFILMIDSNVCRKVCDIIIERFEAQIPDFYDDEALASGHITTTNRNGEKTECPLMSISLAGVDLGAKGFGQYLEVVDACTEVKKKAKTIPGSCFCIDQRTDVPQEGNHGGAATR